MKSTSESISKISHNRSLKNTFLLLFIAVLISIVFIFRYYFWPVVFAIVVFIVLKPLRDLISKYVKIRFISSLATVIIFMLVIAVPFFFLMVTLANQTFNFYQITVHQIQVKEIQEIIYSNKFIAAILDVFNISQDQVLREGINAIRRTSLGFFSSLTDVISFSISFAVNFFFTLLVLFFLCENAENLSVSIYRIMPFPEDIQKEILGKLKEVTKVLVVGNVIIMLLQGFMLGLGFWIFGFSTYLLAGSVAALASLVPVIGTSVVWIPAVAVMLFTNDTGGAVWLSLWCLFWYLILENFVKPKVFGKKLDFNPILFFFLLLGSLKTFNLPGIILGPLLLTLFYSLWEVYKFLDIYRVSSERRNSN